MDRFLYDNGPRHERVKPNDSCFNQLISITHSIFSAFDAHSSLEVRGVNVFCIN